MVGITIDSFILLIEAIRLQILKDRNNAVTLAEIFNSDGMNPYDNSILIKAIISFLQTHFPKQDGFCMIEHYCFEMNFGKIGEELIITVEALWHDLNKNQN
ncbi:hypothetical protein [Flavobacterium caseinilyticum]|uniref:Uncharacterized protein n=1 Tax=Flavobacterium caseinilyticum TaxID=2541732 RepID=A0A4R5AX59_9FLAO|nr:hypothetical protein [Flavobacterium caseinilyticum]TDD77155.1 hypothetical protein E0F89_06025 [Flavobacterium caseinilyticum]